MQVKVIATGEVKHAKNDAITARMIEMGMLEVIKPLAPPPAPSMPTGEAQWGLHKDDDRNGLAIIASCETCGTKMVFIPKLNKAAVAACGMWHCGRKEGVPENLANEYIRRGGGTPFPEARNTWLEEKEFRK